MKTIVSDDLKVRLNFASINGSVIATDILEQLRQNKDVTEVIRWYIQLLQHQTG